MVAVTGVLIPTVLTGGVTPTTGLVDITKSVVAVTTNSKTTANLLVVLRDTHQGERVAPTALLATGRQDHRRAVGSDRDPDCDRLSQSVSGCAAENHVRGCRDQPSAEVSHE